MSLDRNNLVLQARSDTRDYKVKVKEFRAGIFIFVGHLRVNHFKSLDNTRTPRIGHKI